jgi:iron complex transport system substrate-binding protein
VKRIIIILVAIFCYSSLIISCQPNISPVTLTDDIGRTITIDSIPQRIVSHVPSITEMLYALDLDDRVVGVDDYSLFPPEAKEKPSVGNYWEPSIEKIVSLNPDLVLTDGHSESIKQLDNLDINFVVLDPKDISGIFKDLELLGQIAGKQNEAKKLVDNMSTQINAITEKVKNTSPVTVFYVLDAKTDSNNPWTAGPGSFIDSLITMSGGTNIAGKAPGSWVQFSIEQVVADDPQIIILGNNHGTADITKEDLVKLPIWSKLTAVKNANIFNFNADLANPVPRITEGLDDIAGIIHPELFK